MITAIYQVQSTNDESHKNALRLLKEDPKADHDYANNLLNNCKSFDAPQDKSNAEECYDKVLECCEKICPSDDCPMKTTNLQVVAKKGLESLEWSTIDAPPGTDGCVCKLDNDYISIIAKYDNAISRNYSDVIGWNDRGALFGEKCCFDEALRSFKEAISINPNLAEPWYNKGVLLYEEESLEALECFNQSVKINPKFAEAWFNRYPLLLLFDIDLTSPSGKEAQRSYDNALRLKPELEDHLPPVLDFRRMA